MRSGTGTFFIFEIRDITLYRFNTEAKETLLSACARSQRVTRFSLIGPAKRDYGNPEAVIDWVGQQGGACKLVGDDKGHLSGSGENQRIMTFEKAMAVPRRSGRSPSTTSSSSSSPLGADAVAPRRALFDPRISWISIRLESRLLVAIAPRADPECVRVQREKPVLSRRCPRRA